MRLRGSIRRSLAAALLAAAMSWLAAREAAACDSSSCLLVTRGQSGLLPKGAVRIDVSFRLTNQTRLMRGSDVVDQVLRPKVDFENRRLTPGYHDELGGEDRFLQLDVAYGLTPRASLLASLPIFMRRSYDIGHPPVLQETYVTSGNGDALLGVRYALRLGRTDSLVAGLSVEAPTGRHRLKSPVDRVDSGILDPSLQPGSGSLDFVAVLQYSRRMPAAGFDLAWSGSYQRNTANDLDYRIGDDAILGATVSRPAVGRLSASVQVKWAHRGRSAYLGEPVPSTGGTVVYITPGLSLAAFPKTSLYAFAPIPAYRYVNEAQLSPRLGFVVGVSRTFYF